MDGRDESSGKIFLNDLMGPLGGQAKWGGGGRKGGG